MRISNSSSLSSAQVVALSREVDSAYSLVSFGYRMLTGRLCAQPEMDPLFTVLSIGIEKVYKLTICSLRLDAEGRVMSKNEFKDIGHNLQDAADEVAGHVRESIEKAIHPPILRRAEDELRNDPVWPELLGILSSYGRSARFYNLDLLAGAGCAEDSPQDRWEGLKLEIVRRDPRSVELLRMLANPGSREENAAVSAQIYARLAESLQRWWTFIWMAARQGAVGDLGRQWFSTTSRDLDWGR